MYELPQIIFQDIHHFPIYFNHEIEFSGDLVLYNQARQW